MKKYTAVDKTRTLQQTLSTASLSVFCRCKSVSKLSTLDLKPSSAFAKFLTQIIKHQNQTAIQ